MAAAGDHPCQLLATGPRVDICRRTDRSGSRGCAEVSSSQLSALMRRIGCVPLISPTPPDLIGADPSQRNEMWEPAPARSSPMSRSRELAPLHGPPRPAELADHHLHGRLVRLLRREDAAGWRWSGPGPARRSRGGRMKPTEAARHAPSCIVCGVGWSALGSANAWSAPRPSAPDACGSSSGSRWPAPCPRRASRRARHLFRPETTP
jgi:hypothetical protein